MTWRLLATAAVCLSTALPGLTGAHASEPLAASFPTETIAYVRLDLGSTGLARASANSHWTDGRRVAAELDRATGLLCLNNGEALALTATESERLRKSLRQVALAWTPGPGGAVTVAGAALFDDAGMPERLIGRAKERGLLRAVRLAGRPAWELAEPGFEACVFARGPILAVWPDKSRAAAMIAGPKTDLSSVPTFVQAAKAPSRAGPLWAWADVRRACPLWRRLLPGASQQAWAAFEAALGLDKATAVSAAYGGPKGLADQCTVRLWLAGASPMWVQWAGMKQHWRLAGAIPQGCRWAAWGPCDRAAGAWPVIKHTMARLEAAGPSRPFSTLTAGLEAAKGLNFLGHVGGIQEFALVELGDAKLASAADRLVLLLHARDSTTAQAFVSAVDGAALAATSQPAQRRKDKDVVVGRWLTRAGGPAGVYLLRGAVIALGVSETSVISVLRAIRTGKTLEAQPERLTMLRGMGDPNLVILGRADRFLSPCGDMTALGAAIRPDAPAAAALRFLPDGLRLQTTLPAPVLVLLAATKAVR